MLTSRGFAQAVKVMNPGEPVRDADNTTDLPGPAAPVDAVADLWQLNVQQLVLDAAGTVVADWAGLFPPGTPITAESKVRDVTSNVLFRVHGRPELQRSLLSGEPVQIEARLKFISDQQGAPS